MSNPKIRLVTGSSSGFGRAITRAAIEAGDTVIAVARRTAALDDLVAAHPDQVEALALDVTDTERIETAVADIVSRYGRIDVLVDSAGRTQVGAVEETTDRELRDLFDLHFFGPAALTRAVLPQMRAQRSGAIVTMSSVGGQLPFAGFSDYSATKFALEGFAEALAEEVAPFGIDVLVVEPPGDPAKAAAAIRAALEAERTPLRLPLGADSVDAVLAHNDSVRAEVVEWEKVGRATAFE
ncbi:SDR family NAD(P)-dependent oxidoreductase [Nocardia sp. NPDC002869]|uniref:SDR family NAD(P)-dependent oxidoreductase n=1 Tax=Nocardia sp. NPDC002869 TaxID=3161032 RepID=UPI00398D104A